MGKRALFVIATLVVLSPLFVAIESGPAGAVTLPGTVKCSSAGGVWNGTIRFTPPLFNGGSATVEKMVVSATLGSTASPCIPSVASVGPVIGAITGGLGFSMTGANNCATIFSGSALPAPVTGSKFKMTWTTPSGATATTWKQPSNFSFVGAAAMSKITITNGTVAGSFAPFANPNAVLKDVGWPTTIASACASTSGLSSLTLGMSKGKW